jgi:hypothetical protein
MLASSTGAWKIVEILFPDPHSAFSLAYAILAFGNFADDVKVIGVQVDAGAAAGDTAKMSRSDIFHGMASIVENEFWRATQLRPVIPWLEAPVCRQKLFPACSW